MKSRRWQPVSLRKSGSTKQIPSLSKGDGSASPSDSLAQEALRLFQAGRYDAAESICRHLLASDPSHPAALNVLALMLARKGEHERASSLFRQLLGLSPTYPGAYRNFGICLQNLGRFGDARQAYDLALQCDSADADAMNNLANILQMAGDLDGTITWLNRALSIAPDNPAYHYNLGNALRLRSEYEVALVHYERALDLHPSFHQALTRLLYVQHQTCCWRLLEQRNRAADRAIRTAGEQHMRPHEEPHANIGRCEDEAINQLVAAGLSRQMSIHAARRKAPSPSSIRTARPRIAIGYLSSWFCEHPHLYNLAGVFEAHNHDRFVVSLYSTGLDDGSHWRAWLRARCERFVDLQGLASAEAAQAIEKDDLDILVDLDGHIQGSRLEICAFRPAAVTVSYLGFPGTTGAEFIDYLIADQVVLPKASERFYTEKPAHLPDTYFPTYRHHAISDRSCARSDFGLPNEGFVFCSFNQSYKLEPLLFDVWMSILRQVPGSVLWQWRQNACMADNLRREAATRGIDAERIIFADSFPRSQHLARLKLADLALDTRIYNGHTTTQEALWMGVPVITLQGRHFASRVSASLLRAIEMPDLIARTAAEYETLAIKLATNPERLSEVRARLARNQTRCALFDAARYTRGLEDAYEQMVAIQRAGERPRRIQARDPLRPMSS